MIPGPHDAARTYQDNLLDAGLETPGIHFAPYTPKEQPLLLKQTGIAGFMGLTTRGPDRKAIEIDGIDRFRRIFGSSPQGGLLEASIEAYFTNGGERCFVSRVVARDACAASCTLRDASGQSVLRLEALEKGAFGNDLSITVKQADATSTQPGIRNLHSPNPSPNSGSPTSQTQDRHVSSGSVKVLEIRHNRKLIEQLPLHSNTYNPESRFIRIVPANISAMPDNTNLQMSGGRDAIDETTPADFTDSTGSSLKNYQSPLESLIRTGECDALLAPDLFWLHSRAVNLGTGPFFNISNTQKVQKALLDAAKKTDAALAVLDAPPRCSEEEAINWFQSLKSRYAAAYYPWTVSPSGTELPASPSVVGMMARMDKESGPHRAPANVRLSYIAELASFMNTRSAGRLAAAGINCLVENHGIRPWAAVTTNSSELSSTRFINAVKRTLEPGLAWTAFEPNEPALWQRISRRLSAFARELHIRGMLAGETADQAWQIKCDAETNPAEEIAAGKVHAIIDLAPVKPAKFIRISVGINSAN